MKALEQVLQEAVGSLGFALCDFEYSNRNKLLRVFIDKAHEAAADAGVTLDDCEAASRHLQDVLAVEGIAYERLEVSSPGLDRRLKKAGDFERFAGHEAQVRLRQPVNGRRNFVGTVHAVHGNRVELDFEGGRLAFDVVDVERARLVPKL